MNAQTTSYTDKFVFFLNNFLFFLLPAHPNIQLFFTVLSSSFSHQEHYSSKADSERMTDCQTSRVGTNWSSWDPTMYTVVTLICLCILLLLLLIWKKFYPTSFAALCVFLYENPFFPIYSVWVSVSRMQAFFFSGRAKKGVTARTEPTERTKWWNQCTC